MLCLFLYFFIASREDHLEESPREHHDRNPENKYLEKSDNIREESIQDGIIPEKSSHDRWPSSGRIPCYRFIIFWYWEKYLIGNSRDIEKEESDKCIDDLFFLCLDSFFIFWEDHHIDTDEDQPDERESRDKEFCYAEDLEWDGIHGADRVCRSTRESSDRCTFYLIDRFIWDRCSHRWENPHREHEDEENEYDIFSLHGDIVWEMLHESNLDREY